MRVWMWVWVCVHWCVVSCRVCICKVPEQRRGPGRHQRSARESHLTCKFLTNTLRYISERPTPFRYATWWLTTFNYSPTHHKQKEMKHILSIMCPVDNLVEFDWNCLCKEGKSKLSGGNAMKQHMPKGCNVRLLTEKIQKENLKQKKNPEEFDAIRNFSLMMSKNYRVPLEKSFHCSKPPPEDFVKTISLFI